MRQFGLLLAASVLLSFAAALFVVWVWPPRPDEVAPTASRTTTKGSSSHSSGSPSSSEDVPDATASSSPQQAPAQLGVS